MTVQLVISRQVQWQVARPLQLQCFSKLGSICLYHNMSVHLPIYLSLLTIWWANNEYVHVAVYSYNVVNKVMQTNLLSVDILASIVTYNFSSGLNLA